MIDPMKLDDAQKQKVAQWLEQGLRLAEVQKKLDAEWGIRMTYMEVRFLLDDLKLKPKEKELPPAPPADIGQKGVKTASDSKKPAGPLAGEQPGAGEEGEELEDEALPEGGGSVAVTVDRIARPGALVSGGVTFSDGNSAQWYLDQAGRLGLVPKQQGYRPSQPDLLSFQSQLQSELAKLGY